MIFHASIPADEPRRVAQVLAELFGGEALPFPPWPGAFVAMAGDDRNTTIEVYPRTAVMLPGEGDEMVHPGSDAAAPRHGCFHLAVATKLEADQVLAIGEREGWRAVRLSRAGIFDVIEFWVENALMIEVMTEEMQRDYLTRTNIASWKQFIASVPAAA
jgi:hypothetical protein